MPAKPGVAAIAEIVGPILAAVEAEQRPLLIALAERMAGERYRIWAKTYSDSAIRASLRACADREEEIASRVEALYEGAHETQAALRAAHPGLEGLTEAIFGGRSLEEQFAIQAEGERAGAATWRALARAADATAEASKTFLDCAVLEERSAEVLEGLLVPQD